MLFGQLRAASKITVASLLIAKQLEVQVALGSFRGSTKDASEKLVLAVWSDKPCLRQVKEIPDAATLAAAAMANGIKHLNENGNKEFAGMLCDCLHGFLVHIFPTLVMAPERLRGVDRELLELAYQPFGGKKPVPIVIRGIPGL